MLDEVDAPLDETNVGRLAEMLRGMSGETQFVVVTHSKRMMSAADLIYGVTMQEPGVSKLVSVRIGGHEPAQRPTAPPAGRTAGAGLSCSSPANSRKVNLLNARKNPLDRLTPSMRMSLYSAVLAHFHALTKPAQPQTIGPVIPASKAYNLADSD